ncbi:hypothetical protein [Candidatus Manganitrophus noduliformans]|uniref:Uncharacterized protein n=1 Tax=Candidatus Manganitrophus noduliformans TaxID=2606439 RepID=A0A7X6DVS5_9BACT|nr:hypothetical protein [Candidatus Manganitrophus noduliformans]NKE73837.1 hypothetical protein [Candidatus Manganitrophus noduliformans]
MIIYTPTLHIFNIIHRTTLERALSDFVFGYGNSCLIENGIDRLFINFGGEEYGGSEGLLILDTRENSVVGQIKLGEYTRLLGPTESNDQILIGVGGKQILILDTRSHAILTSLNVGFHALRGIADRDQFLLWVPPGRIQALQLTDYQVLPPLPVTGVYEFSLTPDREHLVILRGEEMRTQTDRISFYDRSREMIVHEQFISDGRHLFTSSDGRIFFIEREANTLLLNEVLL